MTVPAPRPAARALAELLLVIAYAAVIVFPSFAARDLWNPDEPRYMEVAREMVALDDYIVPHLNGELYGEKPPVFFWLTAGFYRAGLGFNSERLVSGLAILALSLAVYFLGRRLLPDPGGLLAALMLLTLALFLYIAKVGSIDSLLSLFTTAAFAAAWYAMTGPAPRARLWWLAFYGATGLASLTKGPVGFFMPAFVVVVFAILSRKTVRFGGWVHLPGALLLVGIAAAWVLPAVLRAGWVFGHNILIYQSTRYPGSTGGHNQGPHYYLTQLPWFLFPWIGFAVPAVVKCLIDWRRKGDRDALFLATWVLAILAFFTIVTSKRERYLIPLMPAVALITARYFVMATREGFPWPRLNRWLSSATFAVCSVLALGLLAAFVLLPGTVTSIVAKAKGSDPEVMNALSDLFSPGHRAMAVASAAVGLLASLLGLRLCLRGRVSFRAATLLIVFILTLSVFWDGVGAPVLDPIKSGRGFGQQVRPWLEAADAKYLYRKDFSGVINLYTETVSIPIVAMPATLKEQTKEKREAESVGLLLEALRGPRKVVVIAEQQAIDALRDRLPPSVHECVRDRIGGRGMVALANWKRAAEKR